MRNAFRLVGILTLLLLPLAGCGSGGSSSDASCPKGTGTVVDVVDNEFEPEAICVKPGEEVTWEWKGKQAHNVAGEGFSSELLREGEYTHTFPARGTYEYRCTVHAGMSGEVRVG